MIDPIFQGMNILLILLFKNGTDKNKRTGYYLPKEELKDQNVINDVSIVFHQQIKNDFKHMIIL